MESGRFFWNPKTNQKRIQPVLLESKKESKKNPAGFVGIQKRIQPVLFGIQNRICRMKIGICRGYFQNPKQNPNGVFRILKAYLESKIESSKMKIESFQNLADFFQNPKRIILESRRFFLESKKESFGILLGCFWNPVQFIRLCLAEQIYQ